MSGKSIFRNSALAALAVAMASTAMPSAASAQPDQQRGGWQRGDNRGGESRSENRGGENRGNWRGGGDFRNQQVQRPAAPQVQRPSWGGSAPQARPQPQAQQQARPEQGSRPMWQGRPEGSQRDWGRSQGRDWQSGTVNRPAPADRAGTPAVPQRGWDGKRWNGTNPGNQNGGRDWNRDRDRDRDGRDWNRDNDRDGRNWGRNDRDGRDRDGRDWNRDRNGSYYSHDRNRDYRANDNWRRDNWRNHGRTDYRRWNNDWRRDNRYNWSHYRSVNRGIYRLPRYYSPYRGYNYSRLSIGFFLSSGFYGQNYWINDPWAYRLPPAYGGYRWVRYYDDVLLVDVYSGEVVDVIYDFFW
jgi:hypothetical protein